MPAPSVASRSSGSTCSIAPSSSISCIGAGGRQAPGREREHKKKEKNQPNLQFIRKNGQLWLSDEDDSKRRPIGTGSKSGAADTWLTAIVGGSSLLHPRREAPPKPPRESRHRASSSRREPSEHESQASTARSGHSKKEKSKHRSVADSNGSDRQSSRSGSSEHRSQVSKSSHRSQKHQENTPVYDPTGFGVPQPEYGVPQAEYGMPEYGKHEFGQPAYEVPAYAVPEYSNNQMPNLNAYTQNTWDGAAAGPAFKDLYATDPVSQWTRNVSPLSGDGTGLDQEMWSGGSQTGGARYDDGYMYMRRAPPPPPAPRAPPAPPPPPYLGNYPGSTGSRSHVSSRSHKSGSSSRSHRSQQQREVNLSSTGLELVEHIPPLAPTADTPRVFEYMPPKASYTTPYDVAGLGHGYGSAYPDLHYTVPSEYGETLVGHDRQTPLLLSDGAYPASGYRKTSASSHSSSSSRRSSRSGTSSSSATSSKKHSVSGKTHASSKSGKNHKLAEDLARKRGVGGVYR